MTVRRVLVLGGAGVFGRRIAERLARDPDIEVVLGGRTAARLEATAADLRANGTVARVSTLTLDITRELASTLVEIAPAVIVNATGPFQRQDYGVARAAIAAGVHYVDIADGRAFVAGFGVLDAAARSAGVTAIAGASSVPGLTSVVADVLSAEMAAVDAIEMAILPGNRLPPGRGVVGAILGYAGQPVRLWRDGAWTTAHGWHGGRTFVISGLGRRRGAVCEVPDLELFPARYAGVHTVAFYAGPEQKSLHGAIWALGWLVRAGVMPSAAWLTPLATRAAAWLTRFGTDRSAMIARVAGRDADGLAVVRYWTLYAGRGHGPSIPALPAVIVARRLLADALSPGARACLGEFTLGGFAAEAADLDVRWKETAIGAPGLPLAAVRALPAPVGHLRRSTGPRRYAGEAEVTVTGPGARLLALLAGIPVRGGSVPVAFDIAPIGDGEVWTRRFANARMRSTVRADAADPARLDERLGPLVLSFRLAVGDAAVDWTLIGVRMFGVRVPRALWPSIMARESGDGASYRFDIAARLPFGLGRLGYRGNLGVADGSGEEFAT